ncbi:MAG TPA: RecQ family zinc-binding domain-containing protein, partial [Micromonospora sp.]
EQVGAVDVTADGAFAATGADPADAVDRAVAAAEAHQRLVRSRIRMMRLYAETTGCRRQHLLGYFGEHLTEPCGNCDTCDAGTARRREPGTGEFPADSAVRHREWGAGVVMSVEEDRITVLFDDLGYRTLSLPDVRARGLLVRDR